jgi:ABC-type spermidine/putrescine transport system permease subunit I
MYGNAIQDLFTRGLDWQTGSVLSMFLLMVVATLMVIFGRFIQVRSVAS